MQVHVNFVILISRSLEDEMRKYIVFEYMFPVNILQAGSKKCRNKNIFRRLED